MTIIDTVIIVVIVVTLTLFLTYLLNDVFKEVNKKRFQKSIRNGIENNKIENNDIYILADKWLADKTSIQHCLNIALDYYINSDDKDNSKLVRLREIINWHKKQDPFSELPENIRLQLTTLQNLSDGNKEIVLQLSTSLSELYVSKQKSVRSERRITLISLILAILGLVYSVISPYITTH
ncbi:TPA: hypothetical protein ACJ12U_005046 [Klebsiella pneumoniae]